MVIINGEKTNASGVTVSDYLKSAGYSPDRVAVEKNGEIVPKCKYSETVFADDDTVEIVSFVGGG